MSKKKKSVAKSKGPQTKTQEEVRPVAGLSRSAGVALGSTADAATGAAVDAAAAATAGAAAAAAAGATLDAAPAAALDVACDLGPKAASGATPDPDATSDATLEAAPAAAPEAAPDILFISGSPRAHTCESLAGIIDSGVCATGARSQKFFLSQKQIMPCTGCNACSKTGVCVLASRTVAGRLIDDYLELKAMLERTDALVLVVPLFFAGPPAQLKALFDRMQPYWTERYILNHAPRPKRPAQLFIVGGGDTYGHDPHGHDPLVGIAKSALAVAGFSLEKVHNFIGFRSGKDKPVLPPEGQREKIALGELAQLKRAVAAQEDFEQRALDAGGALARFVVWTRTANAATG